MKKLKALLFGQCFELAIALPSFLDRAGFAVDAIFSNPLFKKSKFIRNLTIAQGGDIIKNLSKIDLDSYDLIIPCDDLALDLIIKSNLEIAQKLKLLPVTHIKAFDHIFSKIGLSKILSLAGITTPDFLVASNILEAKKMAENLGYPVMIKANSSGGGEGVFECQNALDIDLIGNNFFDKPVLVQKKIIGTELDLSAFYQDKKLIFFSYSKIKKVVSGKFGPSVVRLYRQLGSVNKEIFLEMEKLGEALDANGFVTISCIETIDKKRYFIEADMRPNSWIEFPKFIGNDPAIAVSNWFLKKEILAYPQKLNPKYSSEIILPYFNRMTMSEILFNRYKVWKYLPCRDSKLLFYLLALKFEFIVSKIKKYHLIIKKFPKTIKRFPTALIHLALPKKEDRIRVRNYIKQKIGKVGI